MPDLAVGAETETVGGVFGAGAVYVLFMHANGTAQSTTKITAGSGGFVAELTAFSHFGCSVVAIDVDGDGRVELAIGARGDADGGLNAGAVYVLFFTPLGTAGPADAGPTSGRRGLQAAGVEISGVEISSFSKLSATSGGLPVSAESRFGTAITSAGDFDGDGIPDLIVGAPDDEGAGALLIVALRADGSVGSHVKVSPSSWGALGPTLSGGTHFGHAVALTTIAGVMTLAVGAPASPDAGAVFILRLVDSAVQSVTALAPPSDLQPESQFGQALAFAADWDGNGLPELVVGAPRAPEGGSERGAVYVLKLYGDGTRYYDAVKLTEPGGGADNSRFGRAVGVSTAQIRIGLGPSRAGLGLGGVRVGRDWD